MAEPQYDSQPTLAADEEEGAGRGGLLDWQVLQKGWAWFLQKGRSGPGAYS